MNSQLEHLIRERAYQIWEIRKAMGMKYRINRAGQLVEISAQDDWLEAEDDVINPETLNEEE